MWKGPWAPGQSAYEPICRTVWPRAKPPTLTAGVLGPSTWSRLARRPHGAQQVTPRRSLTTSVAALFAGEAVGMVRGRSSVGRRDALTDLPRPLQRRAFLVSCLAL